MKGVRQALRRAAERTAESPHLGLAMCLPRGRAGDEAWLFVMYETPFRDKHMIAWGGVEKFDGPFDRALFLLFLAESL